MFFWFYNNLLNLKGSLFLVECKEFMRGAIFTGISMVMFLALSSYFFILSAILSKVFLFLNLILFWGFLVFLNNLDKILLSNFIFFIPKILELAATSLILAAARLLFIFQSAAVESLFQNLVILISLSLLIWIFFKNVEVLKIAFSLRWIFSGVALIFFYFVFFVETVYAGSGTVDGVIIAADNKSSGACLDFEKVLSKKEISLLTEAADKAPLILDALLKETPEDFITCSSKYRHLSPILGAQILDVKQDATAFESKVLLHVLETSKTCTLGLPTKILTNREIIVVFPSKDDLERSRGLFIDSIMVYKVEDKVGTFKFFYSDRTPVAVEIAEFFNSPAFEQVSILENDKRLNTFFRKLSLGDVLKFDKSSMAPVYVEFKTRSPNFIEVPSNYVERQFVEIQQHLEGQIILPRQELLFKRGSFSNEFLTQNLKRYKSNEISKIVYENFGHRQALLKQNVTLSQRIFTFNTTFGLFIKKFIK